jgi:hypothetical protein
VGTVSMISYSWEIDYTFAYNILIVFIFLILSSQKRNHRRENYHGLLKYILILIAILGTIMNSVLTILLIEAHIWPDILLTHQMTFLENMWMWIFLTFPFTICAMIWAYGRSHMIVERLPSYTS